MIENEFKFYQQHKDELVKQYNGRFIVIKDQKVVAAYASREEAIAEAQKTLPLGSFLIQHVLPQDEQIQRFHSRANFAHAR